MCVSCGCNSYEEKHPGTRSLVYSDITAAAEDAKISPKAAAWNIVKGVNAMSERTDEEAEKAYIELQGQVAHLDIGSIGCDVFKAKEERRYTLGVAYAANRADPYRGKDGFRDFVGADVLRDAAHSFIRKGARIGLDHRKGTDGAGTVVESYLWPDEAPDWPQETGYVVKAGDWLLGVVWTPEAWISIKSGQRGGFSMQGGARRRTPSPGALKTLRAS